jgi:hypothetical protein
MAFSAAKTLGYYQSGRSGRGFHLNERRYGGSSFDRGQRDFALVGGAAVTSIVRERRYRFVLVSFTPTSLVLFMRSQKSER